MPFSNNPWRRVARLRRRSASVVPIATRLGTEEAAPTRSPAGLTLIELLLAMAVAALVVGVVFLVYVTTLNTLRTQTVWRETQAPAVDALDVMTRDLLGALIPFGLTNPPFVLQSQIAGRTQALSLLFFTAVAGNRSNDWRTYSARQIHYSLRSAGTPGGYSLVRQCRPFRISSAAPEATEEILLKALAGMQVQVFNGSDWTSQWGTGSAGGMPQAARMTLHLDPASSARTVTAETLIPVGHRIKAPASAKPGKP